MLENSPSIVDNSHTVEHSNASEHNHSHEGHNHDLATGVSEHHGHNHQQVQLNRDGKLGLAFKIGFTLTAVFVLVEFVAGISVNSLALISDAGHNLTDALALAFSWWAINQARRAPNASKTYGYHRAGILAAFGNAISLILISAFIFYEGVQRLLNPPEVAGWTITIVAAIALTVNLLVAGLLHGWSKQDLNTRSAFLHVLTDALASLGVIIAGISLALTGWKYADPLISLFIAALILWSGWGVVREALNVLLEGIPEGMDMVALMRDLMSQPGVLDIHDLHVWTIGSGFTALSCHLKVADSISLLNAEATIQSVNAMLSKRYNIHHATVQIECAGCINPPTYCAPGS